MPDNDIEMGQPAAERKTESNAVDMADPESFYRINESKGKLCNVSATLLYHPDT